MAKRKVHTRKEYEKTYGPTKDRKTHGPKKDRKKHKAKKK